MEAIIVTAPNEYYGLEQSKRLSLFLAGGITNCEDWQSAMTRLLAKECLIIYNPRRSNFPIDDPAATEIQIAWEYDKLSRVDIVSFWFAVGSDNPIVLYELGMWGNSTDRPIVIGTEPGYNRYRDVIIQTALARSDIKIVHNLLDLCGQIKDIVYGRGNWKR